MVSRRIGALGELVLSTLFLFGFARLWKFQFDHADELDGVEPPPVLPCALATGTVEGVIDRWLFDHDVCDIRTNWRRHLLFGLRSQIQKTFIQRYAADPEAFRYNHAIGETIAWIGYRLWYGLLHPLPGHS